MRNFGFLSGVGGLLFAVSVAGCGSGFRAPNKVCAYSPDWVTLDSFDYSPSDRTLDDYVIDVAPSGAVSYGVRVSPPSSTSVPARLLVRRVEAGAVAGTTLEDFNYSGLSTGSFSSSMKGMRSDSSGALYYVGQVAATNSESRVIVRRLNAGESAFSSLDEFTISSNYTAVHSLAIDSSGRVYVGGLSQDSTTSMASFIRVYASDGPGSNEYLGVASEPGGTNLVQDLVPDRIGRVLAVVGTSSATSGSQESLLVSQAGSGKWAPLSVPAFPRKYVTYTLSPFGDVFGYGYDTSSNILYGVFWKGDSSWTTFEIPESAGVAFPVEDPFSNVVWYESDTSSSTHAYTFKRVPYGASLKRAETIGGLASTSFVQATAFDSAANLYVLLGSNNHVEIKKLGCK